VPKDSASILPPGESAAPVTGTPWVLPKFSWRSFPGRPSGSGAETPAGDVAGECWLAVQADSATTQTTAAAATTLTARMLIRRTTAR
jgi:hypothetical protein